MLSNKDDHRNVQYMDDVKRRRVDKNRERDKKWNVIGFSGVRSNEK